MAYVPEVYCIPINERFHATPIRAGDKPAFVEFLNDHDIYDCTLRIPHPYTDKDADFFLKIVSDTTEKYDHPVHFAIRNDAEKLVGAVGFDGLSHGHKAEIGYWMGKPFWGSGVMTAAVGVLCRFAMTEWELQRIFAYVFEFNKASARVLEKNGFAFEGLLRNDVMKDGKFIDSRLFALVN